MSVTDAVESIHTKQANLKDLSDMLKSMLSEFQRNFSSKLETLDATDKFFAAAKALREELEVALKPVEGSIQALNPIVVDKLYMTLCAQAKHVCGRVNSFQKSCDIVQPTSDAIKEHLHQVEKLVNKYLLSHSSNSKDVDAVFALLDNFLLEIEKDVQEAVEAVTGQEQKLTERGSTPVKQTLKKDKMSLRSSLGHTPEKSPRKGTVSSLKKLFEVGSSKPPEPFKSIPLSPKPLLPSSKNTPQDSKPSDVVAKSTEPSSHVSRSSKLPMESLKNISESPDPTVNVPKQPSEPSTNVSQNQQPVKIEPSQKVPQTVPDWPMDTYPPRRKISTSSVVVETVKSPSKEDMTLSSNDVPTIQSFNVPTTQSLDDVSTNQSPQSPQANNTVVIVKAKEAPIHSAITVNIRSVAKTPPPPPIPPLPNMEEPPKRPPLPDFSDTESSISTPPPVRPPSLPYSNESGQMADSICEEYSSSSPQCENSQELLDLTISTRSDPNSMQSPHEHQSSYYYTSEESQCDISSLEHTPRTHTPQEVNKERQLVNEIDDDIGQNESVSSSPIEEPGDIDEYLSNTSSDVYSNAQSNYGDYFDRVIDLKMQDSIHRRDLSPVIEEMDEDELTRDHPDIGWKGKSKKKELEWSRAHRQSLISMK